MRHPLLTLTVLCGLLLPLSLAAPTVQAAADVAMAASPAPQDARVIVKFKADATVLRKQVLSVAGVATPAQAAALHAARAEALGSRVGLALSAGFGVADRAQVMLAKGISSQQLADKLARDGDVEYAVVDQRRHAYTAPNDAYYSAGPATGASSGGPAVGQWYLRAPDVTVKSSIDVEGAWAVSTGSANIVVAVLDTGLRFDHADLQGGNVLPGYDMVHDAAIANDGDGRDADARDPGDAISLAEDNEVGGKFYHCTEPTNAGTYIGQNSTWHGTQTLGLIGAATNNGVGIASVGRNVRVMPVRVLGKCGGFDSDIIAGMQWAAGLPVAGVPNNATPAKVINMSLGGSGSCSAAYTQAIAAVNAVGAVVVASAGNSEGHAVSTPANCAGVIAVAGLRHVGTKVGFSDLGPQITISAPGGNCINITPGSPCLYPIMTLVNSGTVSPVSNAAGGSAYTDSFRYSLGTSFAAPLVSGTVALMFSANPSLTPLQTRLLMQSTARAFPTTGGDNGDGTAVLACTPPQVDAAGTAVNQDQCYCTTGSCGAGMLDAASAVLAARTGLPMPGVQARIDVPSMPLIAKQSIALTLQNSTFASGQSAAGYQWTLVDGGGIVSLIAGSTSPAATVTATDAGRFTVDGTVVASNGERSTVRVTVAVLAAPVVVAPDPPVPAPAPTTPPTTPTTPAPATPSSGGGALGLQWLALLCLACVAAVRARRA